MGIFKAIFGELPMNCPVCDAVDIPEYKNFHASIFDSSWGLNEAVSEYEELLRFFRGQAHVCWTAVVVGHVDLKKLREFREEFVTTSPKITIYDRILSGKCSHPPAVILRKDICGICKNALGVDAEWAPIDGEEIALAHKACVRRGRS